MSTVTLSQGTAVVWGESGATAAPATTKVLSVDALASATARQGASADLGSSWNQEYLVQLIVETGTAPTAGNTADLYMACSTDNSKWPAGVTGSDAAFTTTNTAVNQLGVAVTQMVSITSSTNVEQIQNPVIWRPSGRYIAPVIVNNLGQAFRDQTTASDNKTRVILTPLNVTIA